MLKAKLSRLIVLAGFVACQADYGGDPVADQQARRRTATDYTASRQAIWNPGPGDPVVREILERSRPLQSEQEFGATVASTPPAAKTGPGVDGATKRTLVLYDKSGAWGTLGELYGIGASNLASHFGAWTAKAAVSYTCGELATFDATIYIGSSYDEPLPVCLVDDVLASTRPVIWSFYNLWQLTNRIGTTTFAGRYGFTWSQLDLKAFDRVTYKGRTLDRYAGNLGGLLATSVTDPTKATVLAVARNTADGSTQPWAVRGGNFTYVADIPFTYMTEEDRYLIFADLLFDALAPQTSERHRAVLRLEDISPVDDPAELRAVADYLYAQGVPFGFGVIAEYTDPRGWYNGGRAERYRLDQAPDLVAALKYMIARGGVPVMHGYTHQFNKLLNPYTSVTGDDTEFYRVYENADHSLTYAGPLAGDSVRATTDRIDNAKRNFTRAQLQQPTVFEFPHYAASVNSYKGAAQRFTTRWERSLYFPGVLAGTTPTYQTMFGQLFPYVVRDVYGTKVLPENLGNIEPEPFYIFPMRFPADIINAAEKNLVVRDGVVGFYFHTFFDLQYLRDTVQGLRGIGYTFVSPNSL